MTITPLAAAKLIAADYKGELVDTVERLDLNGVQSAILAIGSEKILIIRGSNERRDWLYNLDFRRQEAVIDGEVWRWHRGFFTHAQIAYAFAKGKGVTLVIGHSLGAAAAGIVATSFGIPAICFATPRALYGLAGPPTAPLVINYCRIDDMVTSLPFAGQGFNHCGEARWLQPHGPYGGFFEHGIAHYIELLEPLGLTPNAFV